MRFNDVQKNNGVQGVHQGYAFGAAQPTLLHLHRASHLHRAIQQALHRTTTRSVETNEVIMNCRYGTANFSQNHVYADCECMYGNLSSRKLMHYSRDAFHYSRRTTMSSRKITTLRARAVILSSDAAFFVRKRHLLPLAQWLPLMKQWLLVHRWPFVHCNHWCSCVFWCRD